ncbi:MAG: hypothetical protein LBD01_06015 [Puniceicoccales bacterium]|jgi:hypothetical protein|nr:hypothetical protein [Puniceicoccales bacterium]
MNHVPDNNFVLSAPPREPLHTMRDINKLCRIVNSAGSLLSPKHHKISRGVAERAEKGK